MASVALLADNWLSAVAAGLVGSIVATYAFFWALLVLTQDGKEPPLARGLIPYIGPIIAMRRKKGAFYNYMNNKYSQPIYTLRIPGGRIYVINSTALISAVQRQFRTLSFDPIQIQGTKNIIEVSKEALDILDRDVRAGEDGSFLARLIKAVHPSLAAGPALDAMNREAVEILEPCLSELAARGPTTVQLYDYIRKTVMGATTGSVFGPLNPIKDPKIQAAWIKFESKIPLLSLGLLPRWALKEALEAREVLVRAFDQYLAARGQDQGSGYIQRRINFFLQEGISAKDMARFEIGDLIALSTNTIPTAFWLVYHIFSDPAVLEDCRAEVSKAVRQEQDGTCTIDFDHVKNSCPILVSTFWEVFRTHGIGLVPRRALEDHMLDNRYLIKKGSTIFIPYRVQHHDQSQWGEDEAEFRHTRFLKQPGAKRHNAAAFRGFGGGAHLCPGRHFVSAELLLFTAMMILRFDARPLRGDWPRLPVEKSSPVAALDQPDYDLEVELRPRDGVSQRKWNVNFSGAGLTVDADVST